MPEKQTNIFLQESGFVLVISLLVLILLSVLVTAIVTSVNTDISISKNYRCSKEAFYAAEGGVNRGIDILESGASDTWDDELTASVNDTTELDMWADQTAVNTAFYTITLNDSDATPTVDEDGTLLLSSKSTACTNSSRQIDVQLKNNATNISQKHYQEDNVGHASVERGKVANSSRSVF